ncbi:AraC-type DNA-binding protein [Lachnospiraceae bacterium NK3A20]|nr:AraC-type DNA-binding protein [Lachnospiraceae bacterium NK3A20]
MSEIFSENLSQNTDNVKFYMETQTRNPSFNMPYEHSHDILEFYFLRKGQCDYMVNGSYVKLTAGDVMIIAPHDRHSTCYTGKMPSERVVIYINMNALPACFIEQFSAIRTFSARSNRIAVVKSGILALEDLFRRFSHEQISPGSSPDDLLKIYIIELFLILQDKGQLINDTFVPQLGTDATVEQALQIINNDYASHISLESMASNFGLNPAYFSWKFKRSTGHTFKEYLNNVRIRTAMHKLLVTDDSITKIALACGFSSSNYFKDVFRRLNGCSPREYRRRATVSSKFGSGTTQD